MVSKSQFEEVVIPHMQAAFNLAHWIVRNREEAEDVCRTLMSERFVPFRIPAAPRPSLGSWPLCVTSPIGPCRIGGAMRT